MSLHGKTHIAKTVFYTFRYDLTGVLTKRINTIATYPHRPGIVKVNKNGHRIASTVISIVRHKDLTWKDTLQIRNSHTL